MKIRRDHPLFPAFLPEVGRAVARRVRADGMDDTVLYMTDLLIGFSRTDGLLGLRNAHGRPIQSIVEMLAEGDVRLNADTFDREREVHKFVGDYILFWMGVNPRHLSQLTLPDGHRISCDYRVQGKTSYSIVSSFEHAPYAADAPTFGRMSRHYEDLSLALRDAAVSLKLMIG